MEEQLEELRQQVSQRMEELQNQIYNSNSSVKNLEAEVNRLKHSLSDEHYRIDDVQRKLDRKKDR